MPFEFQCPNCGVERWVEDRFDGTRGPCASCGQVIDVARSATTPASSTVRPSASVAGPTSQSVRILLVALAVLAMGTAFLVWVFVAVAVPQIRVALARSRQTGCAANLARIAVAMRAYHQDYGCYPPAVTADANGRPMHSWRVLILPYLGEGPLYAAYDRNEPWDGPTNIALAARMPEVFADMSNPAAVTDGETCFVAIVGDGTVFPRSGCGRQSAIPDGAANTLLIVEMTQSHVTWLEPVDMQVTQMSFSLLPGPGWRLRTSHGDGPHVVTADGTIYGLRADAPNSQLRALVTIDGGETVNWNAIARRP